MTAKRRVAHFRIDEAHRTEQGALRVSAFLTRTGVFDYMLPDGQTIRELRPAEEVFSDESLNTLKGSPVTVLHPSQFVDTKNWRILGVGFVLDAKAADPYVDGTLVITDPRTIKMIEDGDLVEVSCGYTADIEVAPEGETDYDVKQTGLQYNHAALGPEDWGRLGNDVALRLDSTNNLILETNMTKKTITDDKLVDAAPDAEPTEEEEAPKADAEKPGSDPIRSEEEEAPKAEAKDADAEPVVEEDPKADADEEEAPKFDAAEAFGGLNKKLDELLERLPAAKADADEEEAETEDKAGNEENLTAKPFEKKDAKDFAVAVDAAVAQTLRARAAHATLCGPTATQDNKDNTTLATEALAAVGAAPVEGDDEAALLGKAEVAAQAVAATVKSDDEKPSFASRLLGTPDTTPTELTLADRLVQGTK